MTVRSRRPARPSSAEQERRGPDRRGGTALAGRVAATVGSTRGPSLLTQCPRSRGHGQRRTGPGRLRREVGEHGASGTPPASPRRAPRRPAPAGLVGRSPRTSVGGSARARSTAAASRRSPVVVLGPDQGLQPAHGVVVADVERVEVDPAAPDDLGQAGREQGGGRSPSTRALQQDRARPVGRIEARCRRRSSGRSSGPGRGTARRTRRPPAARAARAAPRAPAAASRTGPPRWSGWPATSTVVADGVPLVEQHGPESVVRSGRRRPCQRAAARTRFGCRLATGSESTSASTSGSSATASAQSVKQADDPRACSPKSR